MRLAVRGKVVLGTREIFPAQVGLMEKTKQSVDSLSLKSSEVYWLQALRVLGLGQCHQTPFFKKNCWEFPGSPVVKTPCFH